MEDIIESSIKIVEGLCEMSFTVSGHLCGKRFSIISRAEKQKVNQRYQFFSFLVSLCAFFQRIVRQGRRKLIFVTGWGQFPR